MLFNSFEYLLFLPVVVLAYWFMPGKYRLPALLFASYFFYMSWKAEYGLLLFSLTAINYLFGLLLSSERINSAKWRRLGFIAALTVNLGVLGLFKYTNFFIESSVHLVSGISRIAGIGSLAHSLRADPLPIILPLGISFFVFEFIHYLVDVYKGQMPIRSPLRFGLFAAFFPSQIAGPIKRFEDFDKQALLPKQFDPALFQDGVILIIQGLFKKVALGDNLAPLVNLGFANSAQLSFVDAWAAVLAFTLQIYYDFSGYTDIGRGSANLLGYKLPENFNMPYMARSVSEFWHRWHMSLSIWLRDYLYIPLGGSKNGKLLQMRNLLFTMLLGGLWHGASWTFVLWGAYQGLGLIVCHIWAAFAGKQVSPSGNKLQVLQELNDWLCRLLTFVFIVFGWVLFRAENLDQFESLVAAMLGFSPVLQSGYDLEITRMIWESPLPLAFIIYMLAYQFSTKVPALAGFFKPMPFRLAGAAAAAILIMAFAPRHAVPFIYFQF